MPATEVRLFQTAQGRAPLQEWLDRVPEKAQDKCLAKLELLGQLGYELRRPHAEYLREGIYELRARRGNVQYRMLYFFHEKAVVVSHGFGKKGRRVPPREIDLAVQRKEQYRKDPRGHTHAG